MAWTTIQAPASSIDDEMATFESGVTSVDNFDTTSIGSNRVVALVQYTA